MQTKDKFEQKIVNNLYNRYGKDELVLYLSEKIKYLENLCNSKNLKIIDLNDKLHREIKKTESKRSLYGKIERLEKEILNLKLQNKFDKC